MTTVPQSQPWLKTYKKYGLNHNITLPNRKTSLIDIFEGHFKKYGDRPAYICMGAGLSYNEVDTLSRQFASYLQSLGLKKGDSVAVMMPNILQYPVCMIGVIRAGLTLVNVNPLYTPKELAHQLEDSGAKVLVILENFAKTYQDINKKLVEHVIVCAMGDLMGFVKGFVVNFAVRHIKKMVPAWHIAGHVTFKNAIKQNPASRYKRPTDIIGDDIAVLQYTGGTTGVAKGAMLTHANLVANLYQSLEIAMPVFPDDNEEKYAMVALPLYHIFSFTVCALLSSHMGFINVLIPNPRDLDNFAKEIDTYRPALLPAVNTLFNALAHHKGFRELDHSNLRMSLAGGMAVLPSTAEEWRRVTDSEIIEGYGLSETSPIATITPPQIGQFTGKIGIPFPLTDIKLIDDNDNAVPMGERGEIVIKGPQVMKGYWKRPEATAESMTTDGYFKTGDIGIMDEQGFFKIVDRKKDMILVSGFNVYPNEVEEAIANHPKVLEVGVIGIPDSKSGEIPKAYVVKKDGTLTEKELLEYIKTVLTGYKRPKSVKFVDELPKSNVGKILRKEIRKLEEQNS